MKKILGSLAIAGLLALAVRAESAGDPCISGTGTPILLHWAANGFAYETGAPYVNYTSTSGNLLTVLASPDLLCAQLAGYNLLDPAKEYTVVLTGMVSGGTVYTPLGLGSAKWVTAYSSGTWALYEGPINARNFTAGTIPVPATALPQYAEGTVLLSGTVPSFTTTITYSGITSTYSGSFRGSYYVTGGTRAGDFCNGTPVAGLMDGLWDVNSPPAGYIGHPSGKLDAPDCTTPTRRNTWGKLKLNYR